MIVNDFYIDQTCWSQSQAFIFSTPRGMAPWLTKLHVKPPLSTRAAWQRRPFWDGWRRPNSGGLELYIMLVFCDEPRPFCTFCSVLVERTACYSMVSALFGWPELSKIIQHGNTPSRFQPLRLWRVWIARQFSQFFLKGTAKTGSEPLSGKRGHALLWSQFQGILKDMMS